MTHTFPTGRNYGSAQVLTISVAERGEDGIDWIEVRFRDDARNISGAVRLMDCECDARSIGPAVLREYDAGRYVSR